MSDAGYSGEDAADRMLYGTALHLAALETRFTRVFKKALRANGVNPQRAFDALFTELRRDVVNELVQLDAVTKELDAAKKALNTVRLLTERALATQDEGYRLRLVQAIADTTR